MVTSLNRVVIVEHDDELLAIVESALERDGASMAGLLEYSRTITDAKSQLRPLAAAPKPDLVMVDEAIPLTSSTAGSVSGQGGRKFAEWLVREQVSSRVLLMSRQSPRPARTFEGGRLLVLTFDDLIDPTEFHSWLDGALVPNASVLDTLLPGRGPAASATGAEITIEFQITNAQPSFRVLEPNQPPGKIYPIHPFDKSWLRQQISWYTSERSKVFRHGENGNTLDNGWQMHIDSLGWRLYNDLILGGLQPHYFDDLLKRAGDRDRLHVRFNIEGTELLNVPFESICDPDVDDGYFRIKGPVVCKVARDPERNVDNDRPRPTGGVLDMVFIEAQAEGQLTVRDADRVITLRQWFPKLTNIEGERALFERMHGMTAEELQKAAIFDWPPDHSAPTPAGGLQEDRPADAFSGQDRVNVTFLSPEPGGRSFRARLSDLLQRAEDRPPAVVHFAGHSYKGPDGETYLILPGTRRDEVDGLKVMTFADWVGKAGASFVYLSSCSGASAQTVKSMVEQGVPQVLGFRWDVEDDKAAEFAFGFYRHLLRERRTFGRAYNEACRSLYQIYKSASPIWASPLLVMQGESWWQQSAILLGETN